MASLPLPNPEVVSTSRGSENPSRGEALTPDSWWIVPLAGFEMSCFTATFASKTKLAVRAVVGFLQPTQECGVGV